MKTGLASYRCQNRDIAFNVSQIERAFRETEGQLDLLCFGEAFLQGFDSLTWDYETDRNMAVEQTSDTIRRLAALTCRYGTALLTGYIEKEGDRLYSSCIVLSEGRVLHNYRRISKGWKEFTLTDDHYCEGTETGRFLLLGQDVTIALCGDLWDFPERFRTDHLLIWPVYVNYTPAEWAEGVLDEYAVQAALAAPDVLMVNAIDHDPESHGGAFRFQNGKTTDRIPFDREQVLIVETINDQ